MLRSVKNLQDFNVVASDGAVGQVDRFFFDDERWTIRYLVVDTGNWLLGRRVLISPISIRDVDWIAGRVVLSSTRGMVKSSPDIDTHKPVSRQHETEYFRYYRYPYYWGGAGLWGPGPYPVGLAAENAAEEQARVEAEQDRARAQGDSHLRSSTEVIGYHLHAVDGDLGHVEDFLVDDETWAIRYMVVDTSNWWFGKKALIPPDWIREISWDQQKVFVDVTRRAVREAPEYNAAVHVDRQWETDYYAHYRRPPYWMTWEAVRESSGQADSLVRLKEHNEFDVAEGDRDPRGWRVVAGSDGQTIGKVDDLIADPATMKVRYLDVDLDESTLHLERDRHILLPVRYARLRDEEERVVAEGMSAETAKRVPSYTSLPVMPGYDETFKGIVRQDLRGIGESRDTSTSYPWSIEKRDLSDR